MSAIIMKGTEVASEIKEKLLIEIQELKKNNTNPKLAIIRIGSKPDDLAYERGILKRFSGLEIDTEIFEFPENIKQDEFDSEFMKINNSKENHGILLFRPLKGNLSDEFAKKNINPLKDVDGMSYLNTAKVFEGDFTGFAPCTASAVIETLNHYKINLAGKNVTIIGRSIVIGRPLSMLMLSLNATVTICHTKTKNLNLVCKNSDIIASAAGKIGIINSECVNEKSIVLDIGINVNSNGKLCGDVDFDSVSKIVSMITPVPGGIGAVTTSILARNVLKATKSLS